MSDGDTPSLTVSASHAPAIAQSNRGRDTGDSFETLRAGSHGALPMVFGGASGERDVAVALTAHNGQRYDFDTENFVCGALSAAHGGADDNEAQQGQLIVFQQNQRNEVRDLGGRAGALTSQPGMKQQNYVMAFTERTRAEGRTLEAQEELAYALTNPGSGGRTHSRQIAGQFGVRRLTPVECERLQGFADDWTEWGVDKNGARVEMSDSARYRMLGNAVCRNVSAWIDSQIVRYGY